MLVALAIGVPAGIIAAVKHDTAIDYGATMAALWGLSIPNFWLGILMILLVFGDARLAAGVGLRDPGGEPQAEPC